MKAAICYEFGKPLVVEETARYRLSQINEAIQATESGSVLRNVIVFD